MRFIYLVPQSDVLLVADKKTVSVYFVNEKGRQLLEVTLAFRISIGSDFPDDLIAGTSNIY